MARKEMRYLHPGWNAETDEIMVPPLERDPTLDVPVERNRREMEEAEMRAAREWNANAMSGQEIRAHALELAIKAFPDGIGTSGFYRHRAEFEAYIRNGK